MKVDRVIYSNIMPRGGGCTHLIIFPVKLPPSIPTSLQLSRSSKVEGAFMYAVGNTAEFFLNKNPLLHRNDLVAGTAACLELKGKLRKHHCQ